MILYAREGELSERDSVRGGKWTSKADIISTNGQMFSFSSILLHYILVPVNFGEDYCKIRYIQGLIFPLFIEILKCTFKVEMTCPSFMKKEVDSKIATLA